MSNKLIKRRTIAQIPVSRSEFQYTDENGQFHDASPEDLKENWQVDEYGNPITTSMREVPIEAKAPRPGLLTRYENSDDIEQVMFNNKIRNSRRPWIYPLAALETLPVAAATGVTSVANGALNYVFNNPYIQTLIGADAAYTQAFTDEGWRKTSNILDKAKETQDDVAKTRLYNDAAQSALGDVMDAQFIISPVIRGARAAHNFAKYKGFGNQVLNNLYDAITATEFVEKDGKLVTRGNQYSPLLTSKGTPVRSSESSIFVDSNPKFLVKETSPLGFGENTQSRTGLIKKGLNYVTQFNAPGEIVQPLRFAGYTPEGLIVTRQGKITPFSESGLPSSTMRGLFYNATRGMPEPSRFFTDESLAKYGDVYRLDHGETVPYWTDVRESNIGIDQYGEPKLFDYVLTGGDPKAAGNIHTFNNARVMRNGEYFLTPDGKAIPKYPVEPITIKEGPTIDASFEEIK